MGTDKFGRLTGIINYLESETHAAPLAIFRLIFGMIMLISTLRFWILGWIADHFVYTKVQFKYFGFEWATLLPPTWMYLLHALMVISSVGIMLGFRYRISTVTFFLCFTYTELVDITYYLNHYYFVSWVSFLLIFLPANRYFALDVYRNNAAHSPLVPRWSILILQFLLTMVYFFAGLAKINSTWLLEALPLSIWLPPLYHLPILGALLKISWIPWVFSWAGMLYDCSIVFWLSWQPTRAYAYAAVVVFHLLTGLFFQIGIFPMLMIGATTIFFPATFHEKIVQKLQRLANRKVPPLNNIAQPSFLSIRTKGALFLCFLVFHLCFPLRYLLYPGNVFWTEEGYRFSWRVMLMEKAGTATFYVKDPTTGKEGTVINSDFLCAHQEKQMAMQPDLIVQFAHFLSHYYQQGGMKNPSVRAEVFVTLNGRKSQLLINPNLDLTKIKDQ